MSTSPRINTDSVPSFLMSAFSECDNVNRPPSLNIILRSIQQLTYSGCDIRGVFVDHGRLGSISTVAHEIGKKHSGGSAPPLTPFAAYCFGHALARMLHDGNDDLQTVVIGQDPRAHGSRLADALSRGALSVPRTNVLYTGAATTPACAAMVRQHEAVDAAVMVTASHLPKDRNGFKLFTEQGGFSRQQLLQLRECAMECANGWFGRGIPPPSSGKEAVMATQWVDYMPEYAESLVDVVEKEVGRSEPLKGLKVVVNAGNGAGSFFANIVSDLGANVTALHCEPDPCFPNGVPNPEYAPMMEATTEACRQVVADLGIMLDTDADRCGFIVPNQDGVYEPLHRNRLIALMGVILAETSPGCAVVTDSVTSEGLTTFLENKLGLQHIRYVKGYANVIRKAQELTTRGINAELAIETSGHSAFRENGYLDDGTYTAVKTLSLLASSDRGLLDLIADMKELDDTCELRLGVKDQSLDTMQRVFDFCALEIERACENGTYPSWSLDADNLEGIRIRFGEGQFFMLRKSLHDPIISIQIEALNRRECTVHVIRPLLGLFRAEEQIREGLELSVLDAHKNE